MVVPIPMAMPSTAATIGFLLFTSDCRKITALRGRATSSVAVAACRKSPISLPAENTPERPVRMRQRIAGLDCAVSIASLIARYISCVNVFFFSGRRIVIVRAKSSSLTMMCSVMVSLRNVRPTVSGPPPHACDWLAPALLFTGLRGFGWACDAPGIVFLGGLRYPLERRLVGFFIDRRLLLDGRTVVVALLAETLRIRRRHEG